MSTRLVNAWILLSEDDPKGTDYNSPDSCYQALIENNVYRSVDILNMCFVTTLPTSDTTVPAGDGSSYTIEMGAAAHPGGLTNQEYMNYVIRDARKNNPDIKIAVTLEYGEENNNGNMLSRIFSNPDDPDQRSADNFAANLMAYLKDYDLDGFDIDWESPISGQTSQKQFTLLINAIGAQFKQQTDKHYYLTLSPADVGHLDATAVNNHMDFLNLQLYSGFTSPGEFVTAGVDANLFAYGAKFESRSKFDPAPYQGAENAYDQNNNLYHY